MDQIKRFKQIRADRVKELQAFYKEQSKKYARKRGKTEMPPLPKPSQEFIDYNDEAKYSVGIDWILKLVKFSPDNERD